MTIGLSTPSIIKSPKVAVKLLLLLCVSFDNVVVIVWVCAHTTTNGDNWDDDQKPIVKTSATPIIIIMRCGFNCQKNM